MSSSLDPNLSPSERREFAAKEHQERQRLERLQRADDLRGVMATPEGRRFIWALLQDAGLFGSSFTGEAFGTAFAEGKRANAVQLMRFAQAESRDMYIRMVEEAARAIPVTLAPSSRVRLDR